MSPFVLDASVALAWCIPDEQSEQTEKLLQRCEAGYVFVPALWPTELANGLLVAERRMRIAPDLTAAFLRRIARLDIRVEPPSLSQQDVLEVARTEGLTVYDASYLELAARKSIPLATLDGALIRAAVRRQLPVLS